MKMFSKTLMCILVAALLASVAGCGSKTDESKPIAEVKAEAEKMDIAQLRSMAMQYKDAVVEKKAQVEKLTGDLKNIPLAKMLGEEAKSIKSEIDTVTKSLSALNERLNVYYGKLKEKGGDLSGLTP